MMLDMSAARWNPVDHDWIVGPDGVAYRRRLTKIAPHVGAALVAAGAPVLLGDTMGHQLIWYDGEDAVAAWRDRRNSLQTWIPRPRPGVAQWTADRWESPARDPLIVLTATR